MRSAWAATVAIAVGAAGCMGGEENNRTAEPTASVPVMTATAEALPEVEGAPPSQSQLVGNWREVGGPSGTVFFQFERDGTFALDTDLDAPYFATGTYELKGDVIAFVSDGPICADVWVWRIGIVEGDRESEDRLHIVFLDDGACTEEAGTEGTFGRV